MNRSERHVARLVHIGQSSTTTEGLDETMTNENAKQLKDTLKSRFGRSFCVHTYSSSRGETHTVYVPKTRLDPNRIGFSYEESKELGNAMGLWDFEVDFVIPDLLVCDVLSNLNSSSPVNLIEKRSRLLAGRSG